MPPLEIGATSSCIELVKGADDTIYLGPYDGVFNLRGWNYTGLSGLPFLHIDVILEDRTMFF